MNNNTTPIDKQLWFSSYSYSYKGNSPTFYDSNQFNWALEVEKNASQIVLEVMNYLETRTDLFCNYFNEELTENQEDWQLIFFRFWEKHLESLDALPTFKGIFKSNSQLLSVGISKLSAYSNIKTHTGDSNAYVRCHLPIKIPDGFANCYIKVNGKSREWNQGELLMFCDAYNHSVFNHSAEDRLVLIFDVLLPQFQFRKKEILQNVKTSLWLQKHPVLKNLPFSIIKWAHCLIN